MLKSIFTFFISCCFVLNSFGQALTLNNKLNLSPNIVPAVDKVLPHQTNFSKLTYNPESLSVASNKQFAFEDRIDYWVSMRDFFVTQRQFSGNYPILLWPDTSSIYYKQGFRETADDTGRIYLMPSGRVLYSISAVLPYSGYQLYGQIFDPATSMFNYNVSSGDVGFEPRISSNNSYEVDSVTFEYQYKRGIDTLSATMSKGYVVINDVDSIASFANASITVVNNNIEWDTLVIDTFKFIEGVDFTMGANAASSADSIAAFINRSMMPVTATTIADDSIVNLTASSRGFGGNTIAIAYGDSLGDGGITLSSNTLTGGSSDSLVIDNVTVIPNPSFDFHSGITNSNFADSIAKYINEGVLSSKVMASVNGDTIMLLAKEVGDAGNLSILYMEDSVNLNGIHVSGSALSGGKGSSEIVDKVIIALYNNEGFLYNSRNFTPYFPYDSMSQKVVYRQAFYIDTLYLRTIDTTSSSKSVSVGFPTQILNIGQYVGITLEFLPGFSYSITSDTIATFDADSTLYKPVGKKNIFMVLTHDEGNPQGLPSTTGYDGVPHFNSGHFINEFNRPPYFSSFYKQVAFRSMDVNASGLYTRHLSGQWHVTPYGVTFTDSGCNVNHVFTPKSNLPGTVTYLFDYDGDQAAESSDLVHTFTSGGTRDIGVVAVSGDIQVSYIASVNIPWCTGIEESINAEITAYPNPASSFIEINYKGQKAENVSISILDMQGRVVFSEAYQNIVSRNEQVDVSEFASGLYTLKIQNESGLFTQKLKVTH